MFAVRVNHKNGLYIELLFMDPAQADKCAKECAKAKELGNSHPPKPAGLEVRDDAGRVTWLEGAQIQAVQFVSIEDEVKMNTRLRVVAGLTAAQWIKDMGLEGHPSLGLGGNGHANPGEQASTEQPGLASPAIGGMGHFSA